VLEGRILAVSRQTKATPAKTGSITVAPLVGIPGAPRRVSFAKIKEPLEVPDLLDLQTDSFEWLIGSPVWRERAASRGDNAT